MGKFNQITRPHNAVLGLKVDADAISIIFNQQEGVSHPGERFDLPRSINAQGQQYSFFSKYLAPVLMNLADVQAIGGILVSGNRHVIVFQYKTPVGLFEIAIPTLLSDVERDDAMYRAVDHFFPVEVLDE